MTAPYDIHLDDKYGQLALIDLGAEAAAHEPWFNQTLTTVNNAVVRLGVLEGEFHWHKHDEEGRDAQDERARADGRRDGRTAGRGANGRLSGP